MDASIMNGKDLSAGAVSAVRCIANPIKLARLVMDKVCGTKPPFPKGLPLLHFSNQKGSHCGETLEITVLLKVCDRTKAMLLFKFLKETKILTHDHLTRCYMLSSCIFFSLFSTRGNITHSN